MPDGPIRGNAGKRRSPLPSPLRGSAAQIVRSTPGEGASDLPEMLAAILRLASLQPR